MVQVLGWGEGDPKGHTARVFLRPVSMVEQGLAFGSSFSQRHARSIKRKTSVSSALAVAVFSLGLRSDLN